MSHLPYQVKSTGDSLRRTVERDGKVLGEVRGSPRRPAWHGRTASGALIFASPAYTNPADAAAALVRALEEAAAEGAR